MRYLRSKRNSWPECIQEVWVWGSCLSCKEGKKEQNPVTEVYEINSFSKSAIHRHQDTLLINEPWSNQTNMNTEEDSSPDWSDWTVNNHIHQSCSSSRNRMLIQLKHYHSEET